MIRLRAVPLFAFVQVVCACLALAGAWRLHERIGTARSAASRLASQRAMLRVLTEETPPERREIGDAIEADLARGRRLLAAMQEQLRGPGARPGRGPAPKAPETRADAFLDLATFVETMRAQTEAGGVRVHRDAAHFGFGSQVAAPPERERIEPVFRQRQIVQHLLDTLFAARPQALLAVKRESPLTRKEREQRAAAGRGDRAAVRATGPAQSETGADFFALEPGRSVRTTGIVDAIAFRVVFVGETASLRTWLGRLAAFEWPVVVCDVEVEPASAEETAMAPARDETRMGTAAALQPAYVQSGSGAPPAAGVQPPSKGRASQPLVARRSSKFTVTLEYVELVTPGGGTVVRSGASRRKSSGSSRRPCLLGWIAGRKRASGQAVRPAATPSVRLEGTDPGRAGGSC